MRDYAELVKALRVCGSAPYDCSDCPIESDECNGVMSLFSKAADAIEELLKEVQSRENDCINLTGECATYYARSEELLKEKAKLENSGKLLVAAFERLKSKVPHWISVEERLPEIGKRVLAVESHLIQNVRFRNEYESWFDTDGIFVNEHITHWMPLPKAPKEVE